MKHDKKYHILCLGILTASFCFIGTRYVDSQAEPGQGKDSGSLLWRTPAHDAINCSYLLMRLHNVDISYPELLRSIPPRIAGTQILAIRDVCRDHGLPVSIEKWTPAELFRHSFPVITHMSTNVDNGGTYVLLLACDEKRCLLVPGSAVTIAEIPTDSFRRHWSGYVVTPVASWRNTFSSLGIITILLLAYIVYRVKSGSVNDVVKPGRELLRTECP